MILHLLIDAKLTTEMEKMRLGDKEIASEP